MNYFDMYGIKEVADVVIYSITRIGDEEVYTPVLMFDSLKVSSLSKSSDTITQKGGKGNPSILSWSYIKDIKLKLEDALFSQASMDLYLNGRFMAKHKTHMSLIMKLNIANKYGRKHYHPIAKPSPKLTEAELTLLYAAAEESGVIVNSELYYGATEEQQLNQSLYILRQYDIQNAYVAQNRKILLENYYKRQQIDYSEQDSETKAPDGRYYNLAMPQKVIDTLLNQIESLKQVNSFHNDIYKTQSIDRMEKCIVKNRSGLTISAAEQKENLMRFYADDKSSSFMIYYDPKTMQPFFGLNSNLDFTQDIFTLKQGTVYYKFTRTIDLVEVPDMIIGTELAINPETFPGEYKVVGETYVRSRKDGKDHRMQLILNRVAISPTTNIELKADGGPVTFSLDVTVLKPKGKEDMVTLRQYYVEDDEFHGGTRIIPQNSRHTYTPVIDNKIEEVESNDEFY